MAPDGSFNFDEIALKSRKPIHYEAWRVIHGDNRLFTTSKFAYVSPEGDLLGIAGITRDTTDLPEISDRGVQTSELTRLSSRQTA